MALQDKYKELTDAATASGVTNLQIREQDNVLYIDGEATGAVKQQLWDIYEKLDPDYASGDLMLNINSVAGVAEGTRLKVTTSYSNLNIRSGPGADRPGYDYVVQAEAGLMAITGPADGEPSKVGVAVADLSTGQNAATAILAALLERQRTGLGQRIDVSLFDSQLALLANVGSNVLFTGEDAPRYGNAHASIVPYQAFEAADGAFVLAVASEKLWIQLCTALGREDWLRDPRFLNNAARVANREALCAGLAATFAKQPVSHWLGLMARAGVPAAPINGVRAALDHPVATARGMRVEIDGIPMVGSPIRLSGSPPRLERAPPRLGEHSDEIARAFGFAPEVLRAQGAIR